MARIEEKSLIADIGCGRGVMFEHLLQTKPRGIIAVDLSGEMVARAKTLYRDERLMFINGDVLGAFLPTFDCAVIYNSYPHFADKKALAEKLKSHIRKGGLLIIAHSAGRERINGIHSGKASSISVPLRFAREEADEFLPYFTAEICVDSDDLYFIKLVRT